jgi:hypothetical protein
MRCTRRSRSASNSVSVGTPRLEATASRSRARSSVVIPGEASATSDRSPAVLVGRRTTSESVSSSTSGCSSSDIGADDIGSSRSSLGASNWDGRRRLYILNASDVSKNPKRLEPAASGIREGAQSVVHPFKASVWAQPRLCAQTDVSPCNPRSPSTPQEWLRVKGSGQPSDLSSTTSSAPDLSSIASSAPGLTVCAIVAHQVRIEQFGNS